jgi:hypothetical protein
MHHLAHSHHVSTALYAYCITNTCSTYIVNTARIVSVTFITFYLKTSIFSYAQVVYYRRMD